MLLQIYKYCCIYNRGVGIGPAGPVLAGPFYKKQVINRSSSVIFGLVLIILCYNG